MMSCREVVAGEQQRGVKSRLHLFKAPADRFALLWAYDNRKKKRETRDRGIWSCTFSAIDDEMRATRLSDDVEACWDNLSAVQTNDGTVVALWTSGFSHKRAVCRVVEYDLAAGERRERCVQGTVDTTMLSPQRLMHMGETVFFFDLSHGLVMVER